MGDAQDTTPVSDGDDRHERHRGGDRGRQGSGQPHDHRRTHTVRTRHRVGRVYVPALHAETASPADRVPVRGSEPGRQQAGEPLPQRSREGVGHVPAVV